MRRPGGRRLGLASLDVRRSTARRLGLASSRRAPPERAAARLSVSRRASHARRLDLASLDVRHSRGDSILRLSTGAPKGASSRAPPRSGARAPKQKQTCRTSPARLFQDARGRHRVALAQHRGLAMKGRERGAAPGQPCPAQRRVAPLGRHAPITRGAWPPASPHQGGSAQKRRVVSLRDPGTRPWAGTPAPVSIVRTPTAGA